MMMSNYLGECANKRCGHNKIVVWKNNVTDKYFCTACANHINKFSKNKLVVDYKSYEYQKDFEDFINSDNVIKVENNLYIEQYSQWKIKHTIEDLFLIFLIHYTN